jgi:hypothetical protein
VVEVPKKKSRFKKFKEYIFKGKKKNKVMPNPEEKELESQTEDEEDEEIFPDLDEKAKKIKYEPLLKIPRLEMLIDWDWNPTNHRHNHYFFDDIAYGEESPIEFISRGLRLDIGLNIPKQESQNDQNHTKKSSHIVESSPVPILNYQSELFAVLIELP